MATNNLWSALALLQSQVRTIPHDSKGHGYTYASLDRVWDAVRKPLYDAGLAVAQIVEMVDGRTAVRTVLAHVATSEKIESLTVAPADPNNKARMSPIQQMGSEITYLRRYGLSAMLGLTTDADVDGAWMELPTHGCTESAPSSRVAYEQQQNAKTLSLDETRDWCIGLKERLKEATNAADFSKHKAEAIKHFGELPEMVKITLETAYNVWVRSQPTESK